MENYPDEFTRLYQRPQADMAGASTENLTLTVPYQYALEMMYESDACVF